MKGVVAWVLVLAPIGAAYAYNGAPEHFFLHLLTGADVGITVLLAAALAGRRRLAGAIWLPPLLGLYAMTPDTVWVIGPAHRDWMDVFLLHVALDEILPIALPELALLCLGLFAAYRAFVLPAASVGV